MHDDHLRELCAAELVRHLHDLHQKGRIETHSCGWEWIESPIVAGVFHRVWDAGAAAALKEFDRRVMEATVLDHVEARLAAKAANRK